MLSEDLRYNEFTDHVLTVENFFSHSIRFHHCYITPKISLQHVCCRKKLDGHENVLHDAMYSL
jgi:hypothetical protein